MDKGDFFRPYSKVEIDIASNLAMSIDPNRPMLFSTPYLQHNGTFYDSYFTQEVIRDQQFHDCCFKNVSFDGTCANYVTIKNCTLENCIIAESNFRNSDYSGSKLYVDGSASSFDSSDFSFATIYNAKFNGCSFSDSYFYKSQILNTKLFNSEFESTIFEHSQIIDSELIQTTLDYAEFSNVSLSNVSLPYWGVLHVIKGFADIISNSSVRFATQDSSHISSTKQYVEELDSLTPYFLSVGDYMALVNIYLFQGDVSMAYEAMLSGVIKAVTHRRFKLLRYLCRMASIGGAFSKKQLNGFYIAIENHLETNSLSYIEYKNYISNLQYAKKILIDHPFDQDIMSIILQTNISHEDYEMRSLITETLDTLIAETAPDATSHIETRHNSPVEIVIQISGITINLIAIFAAIEFIFDKSTSYIDRIQKIILNRRQIKNGSISNKDIEALKQQIKDLEKRLEAKELEANGERRSILLPEANELRRISYIISSSKSVPDELRSYSNVFYNSI